MTVEARNGFKEKREQACSKCNGCGKEAGAQCSHCAGKKLVSEVVELVVPIERGLTEGHTLTLKNFGDERELGAPSDLKLTFKEKNDGKWTRSKLNIEYRMEISLKEVTRIINSGNIRGGQRNNPPGRSNLPDPTHRPCAARHHPHYQRRGINLPQG